MMGVAAANSRKAAEMLLTVGRRVVPSTRMVGRRKPKSSKVSFMISMSACTPGRLRNTSVASDSTTPTAINYCALRGKREGVLLEC